MIHENIPFERLSLRLSYQFQQLKFYALQFHFTQLKCSWRCIAVILAILVVLCNWYRKSVNLMSYNSESCRW